MYGLFWKKPVRDKWVPLVCIAAPCLSWCLQYMLNKLWGYETSFELLLINAFFTIAGMMLLSAGHKPAAEKA